MIMFWRIVLGVTKVSVNLSRSATALGAAIVITVGVYDYLRARRRTDYDDQLLRRRLP